MYTTYSKNNGPPIVKKNIIVGSWILWIIFFGFFAANESTLSYEILAWKYFYTLVTSLICEIMVQVSPFRSRYTDISVSVDCFCYSYRLFLMYGIIFQVETPNDQTIAGEMLLILGFIGSILTTPLVYASPYISKYFGKIKTLWQRNRNNDLLLHMRVEEGRGRKNSAREIFLREPDHQEAPEDHINDKRYSIFHLFRFSNAQEKTIMIMGSFISVMNGLIPPFFSNTLGLMIEDIRNNGDDLLSIGEKYARLYLALGLLAFAFSMVSTFCWITVGEKQAIQFRIHYYQCILQKDMKWFDQSNMSQFSSKVANDLSTIQNALGERISTFLYITSSCFGSIIFAFIEGWKLSLILFLIIFFTLTAISIFYSKGKKSIEIETIKAFEIAGGIAEESFRAIRTIKALNIEEIQVEKYHESLIKVSDSKIKLGSLHGYSFGLIFFTMIATFAYGLYYGAYLVQTDLEYNNGSLVTIIYNLTLGTIMVAQLPPVMMTLSEAYEAVKRFEDVNQIISDQKQGDAVVDESQGKIVFKNVKFSFLKDQNVGEEDLVLRGMNFKIEKNQINLIIGPNGSGKSTILQLIARLYDIFDGEILIQDITTMLDIHSYPIREIRKLVGYVEQNPVFFSGTILENLKFGNPNASQIEVERAVALAKADFIEQLDGQYEALIGPGGCTLSTGQKQRLALVRVILKNPEILLLDEATSALDYQTELEIFRNIKGFLEERTTVMVSPTYNLVEFSGKIILINKGELENQGTSDELVIQNKEFRLAKDKKRLSVNYFEPNISADQNQEYHWRQPFPQSIGPTDFCSLVKRLFIYNKSGNCCIFLCLLASTISGAIFPLFGLILSKMLALLSNVNDINFYSDALNCSLQFLILGGILLFSIGFQISLAAQIGEKLTLNLRKEWFSKILNLELGWHDEISNAPGVLTSKLGGDINLLNIFVSRFLIIFIQSLSSLITGIIIGLWTSCELWICSAFSYPILILSAYLYQNVIRRSNSENNKIYKEESRFFMETVTNIKMITSFSNEQIMIDKHKKFFDIPIRTLFSRARNTACAYAVSQFSTFLLFAFIFYIGILKLNNGSVNPEEMYSVIFVVVITSYSLGATVRFIPDFGKAQQVASEIFVIFAINLPPNGNIKWSDRSNWETIEFKNVSFIYPAGKDTNYVLRNINLKIKNGQKIAFVGPSGSGKSTIFNLLLRFYDDFEGEIEIDGISIKNYDVNDLRKLFGVIFQETKLINQPLHELMKQLLGRPDAVREQIEAHIGTFNLDEIGIFNEFQSNMKGRRGDLGVNASNISGAENQVIASSISLIRRHRIYLLDEHTSSLDANNQKILKEIINYITRNKTVITIGHKFESLEDMDLIYVFNKGKIVESGTFLQLMQNGRIFHDLLRGFPV